MSDKWISKEQAALMAGVSVDEVEHFMAKCALGHCGMLHIGIVKKWIEARKAMSDADKQAMAEIAKRHMVRISVAASMFGLSRQRIDELVGKGVLSCVVWGGVKYVSEDEIRLREPRPSGPQRNPPRPDMLSVQQKAEALGISPSAVRYRLRTGALKATRHDGTWWFDKEED